MGFTDVMKQAGYEPKASTVGDKTVYTGIYKMLMVGAEDKRDAKWDNGDPNSSVVGKFKIVERLAGDEPYKSDYPEVTGYYSTSEKDATNRKKGIAKLLDGLASVGVAASGADDDSTVEKLKSLVGSAEVYMKLSPDWKNVKDDAGNWSKKKKDEDGVDVAPFQAHSFLTEANAKKLAKLMQTKAGHPL